jgi:hypothetical protein
MTEQDRTYQSRSRNSSCLNQIALTSGGFIAGAAAVLGLQAGVNYVNSNNAKIDNLTNQLDDLNKRNTLAAIPTITPTITLTPSPSETLVPATIIPEPTPSLTPSPSITPSVEPATIAPTPSLIPSKEPATAVPTENNTFFNTQSYPGEFSFNNLLDTTEDNDQLMNKVKDHLKANFGATDRSNSTTTSLFNSFDKPFNPDPLKEGGLGQTTNDINRYRNVLDVFNSYIAIDAIAHTNDNGLITVGVYGNANDRDAMAAYLATALAYNKNPRNFNGVNTAGFAMEESRTARVIAPWQTKILGKIQKQFIPGLSQEETDRRNPQNTIDFDGSAQLNPSLQKPDQWISCDVYRVMDEAEKQTRENQMQNKRLVTHKAEDIYRFYEGNSEAEMVLMVLSIKQTGEWKVGAFTFRGYDGYKNNTKPVVEGQINSAVGEQMLPCGVSQPAVATPFRAAAEGTPEATVVVTPTRPAPTTTYSPGQTRVPTATGVGPTPNAPTPPNTPSQNIAPTYTPLAQSTSTPFGN